ncbi:MAG: NAD(P)-dependent dehydrogenase (short-subunit alcohol dehydrogenase family) [Candidatus Poriferisodalaceae bacterium]|jgi:NAD(P)-dependent dehydrogenase (short-subunit alcohol dehydrogenase family)
MNLGLDDKVIIITGGSSGIGLATAALLLEEGARVAICGRDTQRLATAAAELGHPDRLLAASADVLETEQVEGFVARVAERWGAVDALVNNAGQSRMSTYANTSDDEWRDELDLKFFGMLRPTRAAEPYLRTSDVGTIVNVNAVLARQPEGRLVATSAARAGALNLTKSLSVELAPDIRVNAVLLGLIDSGQWRRRFEQADTGQTYDEWCAALAANRGIVLGRLGRPDEAATVIATLLSPRTGYVTGTTIEVAGGVSRSV